MSSPCIYYIEIKYNWFSPFCVLCTHPLCTMQVYSVHLFTYEHMYCVSFLIQDVTNVVCTHELCTNVVCLCAYMHCVQMIIAVGAMKPWIRLNWAYVPSFSPWWRYVPSLWAKWRYAQIFHLIFIKNYKKFIGHFLNFYPTETYNIQNMNENIDLL